MNMQDARLRKINTLLLTAIIVVNCYIIALPFLPNMLYWWQHRGGSTSEQAFTHRLTPNPPPATDTTFHAGPQHDGLVIPKMLLDTPLVEGPVRDSFNLLNQGAWRLPFASTPDKGGNTVIAGHRFSYTGPRGVFYFLNKLEAGDEIGLWYQGTLYLYTVQSSRTVAPTEVGVQQPTSDTRLTLYTCTPLWNPTNRLVIVATPKGNS
jgi:sortase A